MRIDQIISNRNGNSLTPGQYRRLKQRYPLLVICSNGMDFLEIWGANWWKEVSPSPKVTELQNEFTQRNLPFDGIPPTKESTLQFIREVIRLMDYEQSNGIKNPLTCGVIWIEQVDENGISKAPWQSHFPEQWPESLNSFQTIAIRLTNDENARFLFAWLLHFYDISFNEIFIYKS